MKFPPYHSIPSIRIHLSAVTCLQKSTPSEERIEIGKKSKRKLNFHKISCNYCRKNGLPHSSSFISCYSSANRTQIDVIEWNSETMLKQSSYRIDDICKCMLVYTYIVSCDSEWTSIHFAHGHTEDKTKA
jgi:hypothetical protein